VGWTRWPVKVPSNSNHSMMVWSYNTERQCHGCREAVPRLQRRGAGAAGAISEPLTPDRAHLLCPCHKPVHGTSPSLPLQSQPPYPAKPAHAASSAHPIPFYLQPTEVTARHRMGAVQGLVLLGCKGSPQHCGACCDSAELSHRAVGQLGELQPPPCGSDTQGTHFPTLWQ